MNPSILITPNAYKAGKLYSIIPTDGAGDLDVVRATTATRVNSDGLIESVGANIPRLDYTNGSCPSILVEPQRTNLLLYSEQFDNAIWETLGTITKTANAIISPDGTLSADLILGGGLNSSVSQLFSGSTGQIYTFSFFIKNNNSTTSQLFVRQNLSAVDARLNWSGATLTSITDVIGTTTFEDYGNGWYRIKSTYTSLESYQRGRIVPTRNTNQSVYIWGAQLEAGSNATSYIPTTTTSVTRNADVISKSGISSLIGQTEGTMYVEIAPLTIENASRDIEISDGNTNRVIIQFNNIGIGAFVIVGGVIQASLNFNILDTNFKKVALKYKVNDFSLFVDGVKVAFDTSGTTFPLNTLTRLDFKKVTPSSLEYYGKVKSLCLWKTALTEQECIELTTL